MASVPNPLGDLLQEQLTALEGNTRVAIFYCCGLLALGVLVSGGLMFVTLPPAVEALKLGPLVVSAALSPIQYRPIVNGRERLAVLRGLARKIAILDTLPPDQRAIVLGLAQDYLKTAAGRP